MANCLLCIANYWLSFAMVLVICQRVAREAPTMYSFLDGQWVYAQTYNCWIGVCVALAAAHFGFFYLFFRASNRKKT